MTVNQLISWGVLIEKDNRIYPTNAYAMLIGSPVLPNTIQCALFKESDRTEVIDMKNISGPVYEQIDYAYQFVLRNIKMKAVIEGLQRRNVFELPTYAIRELIVNAVAHRSYLDRNSIKIALYDDRLEISSPGKLPMGQTLEKMKSGNSTIRNEALVHILQYLNYIEAWGRGIPRIIKSATEAGLKEPTFIGGETELIVNLFRNEQLEGYSTDQSTDQTLYLPVFNDLSEDEKQIIRIISANSYISQKVISEKMTCSVSSVKYHMKKLMDHNVIGRTGTNRKGQWTIRIWNDNRK